MTNKSVGKFVVLDFKNEHYLVCNKLSGFWMLRIWKTNNFVLAYLLLSNTDYEYRRNESSSELELHESFIYLNLCVDCKDDEQLMIL